MSTMTTTSVGLVIPRYELDDHTYPTSRAAVMLLGTSPSATPSPLARQSTPPPSSPSLSAGSLLQQHQHLVPKRKTSWTLPRQRSSPDLRIKKGELSNLVPGSPVPASASPNMMQGIPALSVKSSLPARFTPVAEPGGNVLVVQSPRPILKQTVPLFIEHGDASDLVSLRPPPIITTIPPATATPSPPPCPNSPPPTFMHPLSRSSSALSTSSILSLSAPRRSDSGKSLTFNTTLEKVCYYEPLDSPYEIRNSHFVDLDDSSPPSPASPAASSDDDDTTPTGTKTPGAIWFTTAASRSRKWEIVSRHPSPSTSHPLVHGAPLALDSLRLDESAPSNPVLRGTILVRNLAYEKNVVVRHTSDSWRTSNDTPASFEAVVTPTVQSSPGLDRFSFSLPVPSSATVDEAGECRVQMCIKANIGDREYWDNAGGANHTVVLSLGSSSGKQGA
ncbi:Protein phosphatase 1 regulatory subunit 3E, partial [Irineochytrium annulatum]